MKNENRKQQTTTKCSIYSGLYQTKILDTQTFLLTVALDEQVNQVNEKCQDCNKKKRNENII